MKKSLLSFVLLVLIPLANAGKPPVFSNSDGAIRGYDPVAYFTVGEPIKGSDQYTFEWEGGTFKFASADNMELFKAEPTKYAPQYGGYCAYAVSNGYTATTDPDAWSIVDGKLYLNYSLGVRERWLEDVPGHIAAADKNWPGVLK